MAREEWRWVDPHVQREMAPVAAAGAWNMGAWEEMEEYVTAIDSGAAPTSSANAFLRAVLCVHKGDYKLARGVSCSLCTMRPVCARGGPHAVAIYLSLRIVGY